MKKGIAYISAILLVAIGVSIVGVAYYSIDSLTREITTKQGEQIIGELEWAGTKIGVEHLGPCKVYLRNTGTKEVSLDQLTFYINSVPVDWISSKKRIKKGETTEVNLSTNFVIGGEGNLAIRLGGTLMNIGKLICPTPISCSIKSSCNFSSGEECVLTLSGLTNAQAGNCSSSYPYKLCCANVSIDYSSSTCSSGNGIISLSNNENAQVEEYNLPTGFAVKKNICLTSDKGSLDCIYSTISDCKNQKYGLAFSISDSTNAHIGGYSDYDEVVCCGII
jgi:hypothetical protein